MKIKYLCWVSFCLAIFTLPGFSPLCEAFQSGEGGTTSKTGNQDDANNSTTNTARDKTRFVRLQSDEFDNPIALQTATAKYVLKNDKGEVEFEVSLESVIHIADASYYRSFQQRFERYDSVLYELVAKQSEINRSKENELPSGFQLIQQMSTGSLGFAYQLDEIDYQAKNMLHADLSPNEMSERMADRGETGTTLLVDLLVHIIKKMGADQQNTDATKLQEAESAAKPRKGKLFDLSVLTDPNGIMKIRRLMATSLVDSQLLDSALPPSIHRLVIADRNDRAMSILSTERKKGKRRVAIFYGAGHMADFEKRLVEEHGMELANVVWRNAWDLRDGAVEGAPLEGLIESTFRDSFKNKLRQLAQQRKADSETENSDDSAESAKDEKIESMEKTLKALEAKLKTLEDKSKEDDETSKGSDNSKPKKKKKGEIQIL